MTANKKRQHSAEKQIDLNRSESTGHNNNTGLRWTNADKAMNV